MIDNASGVVEIRIETALGSIDVAIDCDTAPITSANFLGYVETERYDNGVFHRTVTLTNQPDSPIRIEVIQGGIAPDRKRESDAQIQLERTSATGLRHIDGVISMARSTPDSAISEFFICIGDQPELDFGGRRNPDGQGFAAFGRVTTGMDIVRRIQNSPHEAQRLTPPVAILRIRRKV